MKILFDRLIFRYKALEKRETDRQRLIMCHCHFLYDCFSNASMNSTIRSLDERRRSSKRRKSSSISSLNLDEQYCPYTKKLNEESSSKKGKDFQIVCPTDKKCVDLRIKREIWRKLRSKWARKVLVFGEKVRVDRFRSELGEEIESICEAEFLELRPSNVDGLSRFVLLPRSKEKHRNFLFQFVFVFHRVTSIVAENF